MPIIKKCLVTYIKKQLGLRSILHFGKYKDKTIKEIIDINPDYIVWAVTKGIFKLYKTTEDYLENALYYNDLSDEFPMGDYYLWKD